MGRKLEWTLRVHCQPMFWSQQINYGTREKALKTAFKVCVTDPRNKGGNEITLPMMTSLLRNMNPQISDDDIKAVFDSIDMNGKGSIDFDTFKLVFEI